MVESGMQKLTTKKKAIIYVCFGISTSITSICREHRKLQGIRKSANEKKTALVKQLHTNSA